MKKSVFAMIIAAAFLAGGAVANMDILAEATNGDGAWAKLVARVTALEQNPVVNTKFVHLEDDSAGNALGWNPDGITFQFTIVDNDAKDSSIVNPNIDGVIIQACGVDSSEGSITMTCSSPGGVDAPVEGSELNYSLVTPS